MTFAGKIAWITGASSGVGKALALALAAEGARLALSARRAAELGAVATLCQGERPLIVPMNITDAASREAAARSVRERFGGVDFLFNNAGVAQRSACLDTALDVVRSIMEVNFFGPVALTQLVLPDMIRRGSGHIVLTSSLGGKFGAPMRSTYAASKHALHGYFEALRVEQQSNGVAVSFLVIGSVQTDIILHALTADGRPWGIADPSHQNGLAPETFAQLALAGLERGEHEIFIGSPAERTLLRLKRFTPRRLTRQLAALYGAK